jgi:hypothetical protein
MVERASLALAIFGLRVAVVRDRLNAGGRLNNIAGSDRNEEG